MDFEKELFKKSKQVNKMSTILYIAQLCMCIIMGGCLGVEIVGLSQSNFDGIACGIFMIAMAAYFLIKHFKTDILFKIIYEEQTFYIDVLSNIAERLTKLQSDSEQIDGITRIFSVINKIWGTIKNQSENFYIIYYAIVVSKLLETEMQMLFNYSFSKEVFNTFRKNTMAFICKGRSTDEV